MKERFLANDSSYTHIPKKYHKQLICNFSWIFCVTTLQIGSTSATQSVVGVALLRHSRLPRRHALCSLHTIHLSENSANLVTLVLLGFPLPYTKKRIDERYAVGRRRRYAPPLPAARADMHYAASTLFIFHRRLRILSHWYSCAFREHILKSELTSAMQSVVGVALLRHSRLPAPTCTMQPPHYSSFTEDCESCHIGIRALSANIS